jgi:multicomponent K+:H+ antiporter subunit A
MRFPIEFLVLLCVAVGVVPNLVVGNILAVAAHAVLGARMPDYDLAIWHGFNLPLLMSVFALVGGVLFYRLPQAPPQPAPAQRRAGAAPPEGRAGLRNAMLGAGAGALALMRWTSTRRLQPQLLASSRC